MGAQTKYGKTTQQATNEKIKEVVGKSAFDFQNLVEKNKVMIFSATSCDYCYMAKKTLRGLGTQFQSYEMNKEGKEGEMMRNTMQAVTGNRTVPAIFICGRIVPGGGSGLKQLARSGQLTGMLGQCCGGDTTCSRYDKYSLH
eukprot:GFUD01076440.1.p1 GENE.GFUD01076440.1~~GFUD01076440.1.p1  ORF type:complete len:142 (+),score=46.20 GFUD01076440.1:130-555(+)